jgi:hypothetical protein
MHAHGVPRGATPNPGRVLASATDDTCTLDQHGFETGDAIQFRPAGDGDMPTGLSEGTTYYAEYVSDYTFRVRATAGGAAIAFDDAEDPLVVIAPLDKDAAIEYADRLIDDMVPGQAVPFDDATLYPDGVPAIIRMTSAELASVKLLSGSGAASKSLADVADAVHKRLTRWSAGLPVRGTPDESRQNLAAVAVAPYEDRRGWSRWGGI